MKHWKQIVFTCVIAIVLTACSSSEARTNITNTAYARTLNRDSAAENLNGAAAVSNNANYFIRAYGEEYVNLNRGEAARLLRMDANSFADIEVVGWSRSGSLAYRYRYLIDNGMISCWVYSLVVINAVTDLIIEKNTAAITELFNKDFVSNDDLEYVKDISGILGFIIFFKETREEATIEYRDEWNAILGKHNISGRVGDPFSETFRQDLLQFPINDFNSWLEHNIITLRQSGGDNDFDIVSWKLIVGNDRVQKIIAEKEDQEQRFIDNISGRKILGYFKSSYENRIAIVVSHSRFVPFSGGNYSVSLDVFGCDMNAGLNH